MQFSLWQVLVLAVVQGITEFLPISSDGHLAVIKPLLFRGTAPESMDLTIVLHMGTLGSILVFYHRRLLRLLGEDRRVIPLLVIGTIPVVLLVLVSKKLLGDDFEAKLESPLLAGLMLPVSGAALLWSLHKTPGQIEYRDLPLWKSILIGIAQATAILPGLSRSGSTIAAGLGVGMTRSAAASYSFLLAVPALCGAGVYKTLSMLKDREPLSAPVSYLVIGAVVSFAVGLVALRFLDTLLQRGQLHWFGWYCVVLGITVVVWQLCLKPEAPAKEPEATPSLALQASISAHVDRQPQALRLQTHGMAGQRFAAELAAPVFGLRRQHEDGGLFQHAFAQPQPLDLDAASRRSLGGRTRDRLPRSVGGNLKAGGFGRGAREHNARSAAVRPRKRHGRMVVDERGHANLRALEEDGHPGRKGQAFVLGELVALCGVAALRTEAMFVAGAFQGLGDAGSLSQSFVEPGQARDRIANLGDGRCQAVAFIDPSQHARANLAACAEFGRFGRGGRQGIELLLNERPLWIVAAESRERLAERGNRRLRILPLLAVLLDPVVELALQSQNPLAPLGQFGQMLPQPQFFGSDPHAVDSGQALFVEDRGGILRRNSIAAVEGRSSARNEHYTKAGHMPPAPLAPQPHRLFLRNKGGDKRPAQCFDLSCRGPRGASIALVDAGGLP